MKELARRLVAVMFDLRVIVGVVGILLSVALHEVFHIIVHWGEIQSVSLFPDRHAIVEVLFVPSDSYDLVFEEALAYTITMVTLLLTAKLIAEIHDARSQKSLEQVIFGKSKASYHQEFDDLKSMEYLGHLLGVGSLSSTPMQYATKK